MNTVLTNVRLAVKEPTPYSRAIAAKAAQQDVGATTFIFWTRDVTFRRLTVEDYIVADGEKFQVVTCSVENTSIVVTANHYVGAVPKQVVDALASNSLAIEGTADDEVA